MHRNTTIAANVPMSLLAHTHQDPSLPKRNQRLREWFYQSGPIVAGSVLVNSDFGPSKATELQLESCLAQGHMKSPIDPSERSIYHGQPGGPHIYVQLQLSVKLMKLSQTSLQELAVSTTILSEPFHYWKMPAMVTLAVLDFVRAPSETMKPYLAATLAATYELWMLAEKDVGKRRAQWCEAFTILSTGEDAPVRADLVRRARSALSNEAFGDAVVDHYGEKKAERIIRACSLLLGLAESAALRTRSHTEPNSHKRKRSDSGAFVARARGSSTVPALPFKSEP
ncbi:hypothetical protein JCM3766R1_001615 [Sporobolomyces carnicolor]